MVQGTANLAMQVLPSGKLIQFNDMTPEATPSYTETFTMITITVFVQCC